MVVQKYDTAKVSIFGKDVGALAKSPDTGVVSFEYFDGWLKSGFAISHKLPLQPGVFSFPNLSYPTYKGLPAAFADTLPDDFGNSVINAWLARQGRDPQSFSALERLLYTGTRGMGALEYTPALVEGVKNNSELIEMDSLVAMAQLVLDQRNKLNETINADDSEQALSGIVQVGTSAGGARAKAVIAVNADRSQLRSGQVNCPEGFEHFLIKFDGVVERSSSSEVFGDSKGFGLMEYAYYLMAKEAGIDISYCELFRENGRAHFMTKRFDRIGNEKVHYQSLCAMDHADFKKPGAYSYEELFTLLRTLKLDRNAALETFRRMVFNVIARNHDDHTKNWGFILNDQKKWTLAPAFDLAYSYKPGSPWVDSHQMSINGKRDNFVKQDLLGVVPASLKEDAEDVMKKVQKAVLSWRSIATGVGVEPSFIDEIESNHRLSLI
ncbi:type II toxin-antitoxin system HipA family toxin [Amphritea sp. 1_MG-2023]|uniref:type II toxin-antitoxin system HipA family toxin n=1 Tax=Amphritea sp. 1_MG-2023 TaxID=3062670 RepID=UPI0026E388C0|nr:type II toxin-antitoxin system HipA family toxin [Amphritea sp. 1_MG-2023]MDO6562815.1 type II toxin-antitoxin system HipA family toxin [Amphritea sp. 1_MG-2023]